MSVGAIKAGKAYVELGADHNPLKRGLDQAARNLRAWGSAISGIGRQFLMLGSLALAPFIASLKVFGDMGSQLYDMSKRTGFAVESLSALQFAAGQTGVSMEDLEKAIRRMQKNIIGADEESKQAQHALAELGITVDQLVGKMPEEQFAILADHFAKITDPAKRAAAAIALFSRSGTMLLPLLMKGSDGLAEMREHAEKLGVVITTEEATAAKQFQRDMHALWSLVRMVAFQIGAALMPSIKELITAVMPWLTALINWIKLNPQLITLIAASAAGVAALGAGLIAVGFTITTAGTALYWLGAALAFVAEQTIFCMGGFLFHLKTLHGLFMAVKWVVYILELMGADLLHLGEAWDYVVGKAEIAGRVIQQAWGGVADAITAGDLSLAANVVWAAIKVIAINAVYDILHVVVDVWAQMETIWANAVAFAETVWLGMVQATTGAYNIMMGAWNLYAQPIVDWFMQTSPQWEKFCHTMGLFWNQLCKDMGKVWDVLTRGIAIGIAPILAAMVKLGQVSQLMADDIMKSLMKHPLAQGIQAEIGFQGQEIAAGKASIAAELEARLKEIEEERQRNHGAVDETLVHAHEELQKAIDEAKAAGDVARWKQRGLVGPRNQGAPDGDDNPTPGKVKSMVFGAFNAASIRAALGVGSPEQRQEKLQEEMVKQLKIMNKQIEAGGVFT